MRFHEIKGDLFRCTIEDSLCHCISEDCRMGKGIAVLFKQKFGGMNDLKKQVAEGATTGKVAILQRDGRYVYYLISKEKFFDKPSYDDLRSCLEAMHDHIEAHNVKRLAMPKIGCGLDGLQWSKVCEIIKETFENCDIDVFVYSL